MEKIGSGSAQEKGATVVQSEGEKIIADGKGRRHCREESETAAKEPQLAIHGYHIDLKGQDETEGCSSTICPKSQETNKLP